MTPASNTSTVSPGAASDIILKSAQCMVVALTLMLVGGILHMGISPYISFALMGAAVLHVVAKPSARELSAASGCGIVFGAVYFLGGGPLEGYQGNWIAMPGGLVGMGSIEVLAWRWIWASASERRARFRIGSRCGPGRRAVYYHRNWSLARGVFDPR